MDDPYKFDIEKYVAANYADDKGKSSVQVIQLVKNLMLSFNILDPTHYREVCWDLEQRGGVGETVLHLCLLSATSIHADLAKRLLKFYPKLICDIYLSEEYYGSFMDSLSIITFINQIF